MIRQHDFCTTRIPEDFLPNLLSCPNHSTTSKSTHEIRTMKKKCFLQLCRMSHTNYRQVNRVKNCFRLCLLVTTIHHRHFTISLLRHSQSSPTFTHRPGSHRQCPSSIMLSPVSVKHILSQALHDVQFFMQSPEVKQSAKQCDAFRHSASKLFSVGMPMHSRI